jgi:2-phosphoglycolate phosphatase
MTLQGVVFDLDGTLIDSTEAIVASMFHMFDALSLDRPPREAIIGSIGAVLEKQVATMTDHDPIECARVYRAHYADTACEQTIALPGARDALQSLANAGFALGFATSKRRTYAEIILNHLGLLDFFTARVGPDDVTNHKPHPEPIELAATQLGIVPPAMLYVGDLPIDHQAATAAGAACCCVTTGYASRDELESAGVAHVFDGLADVAKHVFDGQRPS